MQNDIADRVDYAEEHMKCLIVIGLLLALSACGTTREKWVSQNCGEAGGYQMGQSDARVGRVFSLDAIEKCPSDQREVTRKAYLDGFRKAGGKEPVDGEHKYGADLFQDVVHAINKNPKKKPQETSVAAPEKENSDKK